MTSQPALFLFAYAKSPHVVLGARTHLFPVLPLSFSFVFGIKLCGIGPAHLRSFVAWGRGLDGAQDFAHLKEEARMVGGTLFTRPVHTCPFSSSAPRALLLLGARETCSVQLSTFSVSVRPVRPTVAPGAPHEEAGAVHTQWPRGHFPYNEFTISRCAAGAHLACARGTMPRAPLGRTGLVSVCR